MFKKKPDSIPLVRLISNSILFLVSQAPAALCAVWFSLNKRYPTGDDAALQLFSGIKAYHSWQRDGIFAALHDLYFIREFKPILNPIFAFPALILTKGDIRATVAVVNVVLLSTFLLFLYKFLRLYLARTQASIGTCLIGLLPWVLRSSIIYSIELPLMTACMASVYFLLRCDYFTSGRHCLFLGLSLGTALCIHPIVVTMGFGPALLSLAILSILSGKLKTKDLLMAVSSGLIFILTMTLTCFANKDLLFIKPHEEIRVAIASIPVVSAWTIFWWAGAMRGKMSKGFFFAISTAILMMHAWYFPFFNQLFGWIEAGAFSSNLKYCGELRGKTYQTIYMDFGRQILLLTALMILWRSLQFLRGQGKNNPFMRPTLATLLPLVAGPPLIGLFSVNADVRYYFFYFTMMYAMGIIVISVRERSGLFLKFLGTAYFVLGLTNALIVSQIIFQWNIPSLRKTGEIMGYRTYNDRYLGIVPFTTAEPALSIARQVSDILDPREPVVVGYAAYEDMNHYELRLICMEGGKDITFNAIWLMDVEGMEDQIANVCESYQYVFFGPCNWLSPTKLDPPWNQRLYDFALELNNRHKSGTLESSGFHVMREVWTYDRRSNFLLLQSKRAAT